MARTPEWETLEMAVGDPKPAWLMPSVKPKFALWSLGGGRPFGCPLSTCKRWHAGIDLTGVAGGSVVLSPEDATVVAVDRGWSRGSKAIFLRTDSDLFLVLGGVILGSSKEFDVKSGQHVRKGDRLGRVLGSYGMIHFETYLADGRRANSPWWRGKRPPKGLLNPTNYVERMIGDRISLVRTVQRHEALAALGYFEGEISGPWGTASKAALVAAQGALGIEADGAWGPKTGDVIFAALAEAQASGNSGGDPRDTTGTPASNGWRWLAVGGVTVAAAATLAVIWNRIRP